MTKRLTTAALLGLLMVVAGGCQKEKGGGGGPGGGGSALDYPADSSLIVGFTRKGPAPSAADLTAAIEALMGEKADKEIAQLIDACIAPVSAHLETSSMAVRGPLEKGQVVGWASGPGLRPALEGCLKSVTAMNKRPFEPRQDGDYTLYPLEADEPIVARWTGTDQMIFAAKKEEIESARSAAGGLKGTPLEKAMGEVDRSGTLWFAAAGPGLPEEAQLESATGSIADLTGTVRARFKNPQAAGQALALIQTRIPKGAKVKDAELTIGLNVADLPTLLIVDKRGTGPKPPLSPEHARALLAAGPLMVAFLLVAEGHSEATAVEAAPPVPAEPAAPADPAAPAPAAEPVAP